MMTLKKHILSLVAYQDKSFNAFFLDHLDKIDDEDDFKSLSLEFCENISRVYLKQYFVLFFHLYINRNQPFLKQCFQLYQLQFHEPHIAAWFEIEKIQIELENHLKCRQSVFSILLDGEVVHEQPKVNVEEFDFNDVEAPPLEDLLDQF